MRVVVTGAAGFIGTNLIKELNARGINDIIAVDNLNSLGKARNLADCQISDYCDKRDFLKQLYNGRFKGAIHAILHQGACSNTTESNADYMMQNNYYYSIELLNWAEYMKIPLIYASSASIYGGGKTFREEAACEKPLNIYGYSKLLFDQIVRHRLKSAKTQIVGLRYFNVYGPYESHKGHMASVALHNFKQFLEHAKVRLFEGSHGYTNGEQRRDFVFVEDVIYANLWFLDNPSISGIFNMGSGKARTFNDIAKAIVNECRRFHEKRELSLHELISLGHIEYIPIPQTIKNKYQPYTKAEFSRLHEIGYECNFQTIEQGVGKYVKWLYHNLPKL